MSLNCTARTGFMRMAAREEPDLENGARRPITEAAATGSSMNSMEVKVPLKERLEKIKIEKDDDYEKRCIFRVPGNLRDVHEKATYNPQMVSIGPYHRKDAQVQAMEKHKVRLLKKFLDGNKVDYDDSFKTMTSLEKEMRDCYAGLDDNERIESREFVEMMLLDACFIFDLFYPYHPESNWKSDPLFSAPAIKSCIRRDMLMLENQIPLFVLERLFKLTVKEGGDDKNLVPSLALKFFKHAIDVGRENLDGIQENNSDSTKHLHLLQIIWKSLLPSSDPKNQQSRSRNCFSVIHDICHQWRKWNKEGESDQTKKKSPSMHHSAWELVDNGVGFKKCDPWKIMDIAFEKSQLKIPQLVINDSTRTILRNLMAFEQCYKCSNHVTRYVNFMDGLINDPFDVLLLQKKKIIVHRLGSEEDVASIFNSLCREMALDINDLGYLWKVSEDLEEFIGKRRHMWFAMFKRKHLENPWAIISIVAAIMLLTLTTMGALYCILSFHIHHS